MKRLILILLLLTSACTEKNQSITLAEAAKMPLYGVIDLTSPQSPINTVNFFFSNGHATLDLSIDTGSQTVLTAPVPKIESYKLLFMHISTSEGLIFLSFSDQCSTINDMPDMLRFSGKNYSIPALMVPHLTNEHYCFYYQSTPGGTY